MEINLIDKIKQYKQEHLLAYIDELNEEDRSNLIAQLKIVDFSELDKLIKKYVMSDYQISIPSNLEPASYFSTFPEGDEQKEFYLKAIEKGQLLLKQGKVAALTVAGGQGSRLGFDGPKGSYPLDIVVTKTLFEYFAESLLRAGEKYGAPIRWYIMTSSVNDLETKEFFIKNNYFGMAADQVIFFVQGTMPAIGNDGKILLKNKSSLALAPDGHGGTLLALNSSGALEDMKNNGVEHLSYFQVDNPLVSVVDPLFLGLHKLEESEVSSRALIKTGPFEKLGNFCMVDGSLEIIEYSDMPDELSQEVDENGVLKFRAGSPAIHIFKRDFVERLTAGGTLHLPWHRADKKVPCLDASGVEIDPEEPNAVKLETFIFDAIPMANKTMILAAAREEEFAPVKNKTGVDSAESCREMLINRDARWLEAAGVKVERDDKGAVAAVIQLSPRIFLDREDVVEYYSNKELVIKAGERVFIK